MRAYARRSATTRSCGASTGLLHDLDYERYPDLETGHPRMALGSSSAGLRRRSSIRAIASHADFLGVSRDSRDGEDAVRRRRAVRLHRRVAYVRPEGIHGMTPKSVKKKLKQPSFAAAVNRDELRSGAEELGVDFDEHLAFVIAALEPKAAELGLEGAGARATG